MIPDTDSYYRLNDVSPYHKFYKLRVTCTAKQFKPLFTEFIHHYCTNYLIAWEVSKEDKEHCHMYIETRKSRQSMVKWIHRNIGKGNGIYSMKILREKRPIEYLAYCIKDVAKNGRDDPKTHQLLGYWETDLPDELMKEVEAYDQVVKDEMKKAKKEKASITSFKTISNWLEERRSDFTSNTSTGEGVDHIKLVQLVLRYYQQHSLFVREFHITSLCQTLLLKFDKNYSYQLADKISQRL